MRDRGMRRMHGCYAPSGLEFRCDRAHCGVVAMMRRCKPELIPMLDLNTLSKEQLIAKANTALLATKAQS